MPADRFIIYQGANRYRFYDPQREAFCSPPLTAPEILADANPVSFLDNLRVLHRHYLGRFSKAEARAFFNIVPH